MTSAERRQVRFARRKAERDQKKQLYYSQFDDFSLVSDPDNLLKAARASKKSVTWKESVQRYNINLLINIASSVRKLNEGESITCGFVEFDLRERGKTRHIKSVHISERVIQKCLSDQVLVPVLSRSLIYDNGASLKDKGLHFSMRRLKTHLSKYYRHYGNSGYCLSIDFSKYFDNIRHDILLKQIDYFLHDKKIIDLVHSLIKPFGDGISLGLGSQVSQIAAIFYANKLDHYIREKYRIIYHGRYMDDLYLIHESKEYLKQCLGEIDVICKTLGITINKKKTKIVKLKDGVKFLKGIYTLTESGKIVCRADTAARKRMRRKLVKYKKLLEAGKITNEDIRISYQSWRGNYIRRFNAYHTIRRMDSLYDGLFINNRRII